MKVRLEPLRMTIDWRVGSSTVEYAVIVESDRYSGPIGEGRALAEDPKVIECLSALLEATRSFLNTNAGFEEVPVVPQKEEDDREL